MQQQIERTRDEGLGLALKLTKLKAETVTANETAAAGRQKKREKAENELRKKIRHPIKVVTEGKSSEDKRNEVEDQASQMSGRTMIDATEKINVAEEMDRGKPNNRKPRNLCVMQASSVC